MEWPARTRCTELACGSGSTQRAHERRGDLRCLATSADEAEVKRDGERSSTACLCGLTFELTGARRQDALARLAKMYRVPPTGPRRPAVARPVERVVRPRSIQDKIGVVLLACVRGLLWDLHSFFCRNLE